MALTKLPAGSLVDGSITSVKIANATILTEDIGTGAITADKITTTLDLSSHTVTLPLDLIGQGQLNMSYDSSNDIDKFLQISSTGALQWATPIPPPTTYSALSGLIPAGHIDAGTITSTMIGDQEVADSNIADGTISAGKLNTTLDLSTKTITYPTDSSLTNLTITGNLHLLGTTTEIDTENLLVKDNIIVINDDESGPGVSASAAGIEINRGPGEDKATIMWDEASSKFEFRLGANTVDLVYTTEAYADDIIGYDHLKINNPTDPGPGINTFLESDGTGNFNLIQVNSSNFLLSGDITGTLQNNVIPDDSIGTDKLEDYSITSVKIDTSLSFVGKTITLNASDILTAINGTGYFNISNPNFNVPDNCIDSAAILDGSVTGFKLAPTLDISGKTIIWPDLLTFGSVIVDDSFVLPVGNTNDRGIASQGKIRYSTELATFEGYDGSNWGSLGGVIDVNQDTYITAEATTDSDNLDFWTAGTKQMTIDQAGNATFTGDVSVSNLTIDKNIVEKLGTATSSGTTVTIDLATGNNFIVDLESTTGNITTFTINNINSTANSVTTFIMKVIQGSVDRVFVWSGISAVKWPDSLGDGSLTGIIPPVITTGNDKEDIYSFTSYNNGSTWYGRVIGMDYS